MRGGERRQRAMLVVIDPEKRVPQEHPIRRIKQLADAALKQLSPVFDEMYSVVGRPSIPPERLLKASLLMALYTVRSERLFCERLDYDLLFRWFLDLEMDEASFDHSTFSRNRARLLEHEVAGEFFRAVVDQARALRLLSDEHFTVDGTLLEAWASVKSFKRKDTGAAPPDDPGNPTVDFHGERRSNETHASTTDPEARLARKGKGGEAKLSYAGHAMIDNRHGLVVNAEATQATGSAERETGIEMASALPEGTTVGADKSYDTHAFVEALRSLKVTPHVAQNTSNRSSAIDGRTTRHAGYLVSQQKRKLIEEVFGWLKTVGLMRKLRHRGTRRVDWLFTFATAVYNLVRIRNLLEPAA